MTQRAELHDHTAAVYGITVAARLVGTGVQNLRAYERAGLVDPHRTDGGTRLYSQADIERLGEVQILLRRGLNLVGISMVFELQADNERLRRELSSREASTAAGEPVMPAADPPDRPAAADRIGRASRRPRR